MTKISYKIIIKKKSLISQLKILKETKKVEHKNKILEKRKRGF